MAAGEPAPGEAAPAGDPLLLVPGAVPVVGSPVGVGVPPAASGPGLGPVLPSPVIVAPVPVLVGVPVSPVPVAVPGVLPVPVPVVAPLFTPLPAKTLPVGGVLVDGPLVPMLDPYIMLSGSSASNIGIERPGFEPARPVIPLGIVEPGALGVETPAEEGIVAGAVGAESAGGGTTEVASGEAGFRAAPASKSGFAGRTIR